MDPVSKGIVAALNTAANGPPQTVARSYQTLKTMLEHKFGSESELLKAIEQLEVKPDSTGRRAVLAEEVKATGADQDPEILEVVGALVEKIKDHTGGPLPLHAASVDGAFQDTARSSLPGGSGPLPLQLPVRAKHFIGRQAEMEWLLASLRPGQIVTLCGPGGVGKSTLAAEAVWRLTHGHRPPDGFPDGLIFYSFYCQPQVDLALEHIVRARGEALWPTPVEAARPVLAGRKMLLVLDGAEVADDLPKILALQGDCGLLLISRDGENPPGEALTVPPLPLEEAVILLQTWAGVRANEEPTARRICELVGGLPLAIRLISRYLIARSQAADIYLAWLQETPLATLDNDDRVKESVPLLIAHSLDPVSATAQNAFAVAGSLALAPIEAEVIAEALELGVHGGFWATIRRIFRHETEDDSAAEELPEERQVLDELVTIGLMRRRGARYEIGQTMLYSYARRQISLPDGAMERLISYYTTLVGEQILLGLDGFTTLDAERPHLMQILAACVEQAHWTAAYGLATAVEDYLDLQGHRTERIIANKIGLAAARELGRHHNEGAWLGNLGLAYSEMGQPEQAIDYYQQALAIAREIGDLRSEGNNLGRLGLAYRDLGEIEKTRDYLGRALAIFEEINSPSAEMVQDWLAEFREEAQ